MVVLPSVVFQVPSAAVRPPAKSVVLLEQRSNVLKVQETSCELPGGLKVITTLKVHEAPGKQAVVFVVRSTPLTFPAEAGAKTGPWPGVGVAAFEGEDLGD